MGKTEQVNRAPRLSEALKWLHIQPQAVEDEEEGEYHSEAGSSLKGSEYRLVRADLEVPLFSYQRELVDKLVDAALQGHRALLSLPTGAGKTRTALAAFLEARQVDSAVKWVWLAPTLELLAQARDTLENLWTVAPKYRDLSMGFRTKSPRGIDIWFTTPQAARVAPLADLAGISTILFDEAHQLGAPTFREAVVQCERGGASVIGLSATPGRFLSDETEDLVDFFGRRLLTSSELGRNAVETLQELGVLSKIHFRNLDSRGTLLNREERLRRVAARTLDLVLKGRKVLVFAPSVAEAQALNRYLSLKRANSYFVDGRMNDSARVASLNAFDGVSTGALVNSRLLATGYDCPAVSDVILGNRIGSPVLFEQMVGRAARGPKTGGSSSSRVWQFEDHLMLHGLPTSYYRYRDFAWNV